MPVSPGGKYAMNPRLASTPDSPATKGATPPAADDPGDAAPPESQTMVVHSHDKGHTLHVLHQDGTAEKEDYNPGEEDQVADSVRSHLGGGGDQPIMTGLPEGGDTEGNPQF